MVCTLVYVLVTSVCLSLVRLSVLSLHHPLFSNSSRLAYISLSLSVTLPLSLTRLVPTLIFDPKRKEKGLCVSLSLSLSRSLARSPPHPLIDRGCKPINNVTLVIYIVCYYRFLGYYRQTRRNIQPY